ncbi:hypothetical protein Y032_0397g700 [Ancylostoma ceylanicum]|uniref:Signal peptide peptidase n=1 Tax=Ancylostoma ceylanicum TaxID=53326 RepID=A0A016RR77_9BILA|nr:hypothetical protein Y032_0397g700 [Ancylostoma ceylanicum]
MISRVAPHDAQDLSTLWIAAELNQLKRYGAENAILLVEKGKQFITRWHDYLFSDFYDPYVNASDAIGTFFLYAHVFQNEILGLVKGSDVSSLQLRFHRPNPYPIDLSMIVMWLLAVGCVTGGGAWAFVRHRAGKDKLPVASPTSCSSQPSSSDSITDSKKKCIAFYSNFLAIAFLMVILVGILMIGFFFRPILVAFFNGLLVVFGSISVYGCAMALLSNCSMCECCSKRLCTGFQHRWLPKGRPNILQLIVFMLSLVLCVIWFVFRRTPYAFILLDFINVTLCLHILKSLRLPNVMWITVLMICMFVYDAVMVFVTPYLTSNGCSVMLEVATGIGCSSDGNDGYPMPPVDAALPEKFPMLMQVPRFDPVISCVDLAIEKTLQMTILGMGDIIIPGYLVTHCFTMNGFSERSRVMYGILASFGYGIGLIATFIALSLMNMAQPALIYLVPCTLLPIFVMAYIKGHFRLMWHGTSDSTDSTESLKPSSLCNTVKILLILYMVCGGAQRQFQTL